MTNPSSPITISAKDLGRNYGGRAAVDGVSFELRQGEVLGFLGPNGAGKSTTMRMLTGNLAPSTGSVNICGIDLLDSPKTAKAKIGYLPETPPLYRELTVNEYLRLVARLHRVARQSIPAAVQRSVERCGLTTVANKLIGTLSKGYQQRVGIAQAIVHSPDVVILDEPTVGLDPIQIREIRSLIRELGGSHSVILSTHILPEVESICDRVQIMHAGRLVFSDSIAGLQQFRRGNGVVLGLRKPPALEELQGIPGVVSAQALSATEFRLQFAEDTDPTETIVKTAAEQHWGLQQLTPAQASLEEVFVQLTQQEEPA